MWSATGGGSRCSAEFNTPYDASWAGFIEKAFRRIDGWNAGHAGRIRSASYFAYDLPGWDRTNLTRFPIALDEYRRVTATTAYLSR